MADISIIGVIDRIQYIPNNNCGVISVTETKHGYKRKDGEYVNDKYYTWRCYFKAGQYNYINTHFNNGMCVQVKGQILPRSNDQGIEDEWYSVLIDSINLFSLPRLYGRKEDKMIKESQMATKETPNLAAFNEPDF